MRAVSRALLGSRLGEKLAAGVDGAGAAGAKAARTGPGATSWVDEASTKPVSQETLAGIPWAGRSTLAGLFQRVAANGPRDPAVWRKLFARADVIAHSLTAKQASMILSSMVKVQQRDATFLRRFTVKCAPSLIEGAELLDLCGLISGLSQLGSYSEETFALAARRAAESASQMDARQLSLMANAFVRVGHSDLELFQSLLRQVPRRLRRSSGRDLAVLANALAQLPALGVPSEELQQSLEAIALRLPEQLPSSDLHTVTLLLNSFAQLQFVQKDVLDLISEEFLANDQQRVQQLTARQLAMVLNGAARLQLYEPRLMDALSGHIRPRAQGLDAQALCVVANAAAKLQFGHATFQVLYTQVPKHLTKLTGRQLSMLCHAWAKAHVHNDDLFALMALPLSKCAADLSAHEVAMAVYGYAHFRKAPAELFNPLMKRFAELLEKRAVPDGDLLMLANALGRVGWQDTAVASALRAYAAREPGLRNLSPQALATFNLVGEELFTDDGFPSDPPPADPAAPETAGDSRT